MAKAKKKPSTKTAASAKRGAGGRKPVTAPAPEAAAVSQDMEAPKPLKQDMSEDSIPYTGGEDD